MSRWNQGRATIDALIERGAVERVPASREAAEAELGRARTHIASARLLLDSDPEGAYTKARVAHWRRFAEPRPACDEPWWSHCHLRSCSGSARSSAGVGFAPLQPDAGPTQ
jgi:hypothetical protein